MIKQTAKKKKKNDDVLGGMEGVEIDSEGT